MCNSLFASEIFLVVGVIMAKALPSYFSEDSKSYFKVIPQEKKFPMNFLETFPECFPPSIV